MPELPEVETVRRGLQSLVLDKIVKKIIVRESRLRIPIENSIQKFCSQRIETIERRGKYLIFKTNAHQGLLIHLGMSGRIHYLQQDVPANKHDHVDFILDDDFLFRFHDPRRFGLIVWLEDNIFQHPLLSVLGPEPLSQDFSADYLFKKIKKSARTIKNLIMDHTLVVGVGNIYANEALFHARLHPSRKGLTLTYSEVEQLVKSIHIILNQAIIAGGTTLKDFGDIEGKPGYFQQELMVYGRAGHHCLACQTTLQEIRLQNRTTVFCSTCQL